MSNPVFSYTARDYESSRQEGIARLPALSNGTWTDLNASDPGIVLVDYVHALVDMCNYYLDHQAMETFIPTAKERANLFRLAKQFSYNIRSAKGAKVDVVFFLEDAHPSTVIIPRHTKVHTSTGIYFLTTEAAYIPAGEFEVTVPCIQGVITTAVYEGTGISQHSVNVENPQNQSVTLIDPGIDIDSIEIIDNAGILWNPVDHLIFTTANERAYQKNLKVDNTIEILFGDGNRGAIPQTSDTLTIQYIRSLGEKGRVSPLAITTLDDRIKDIQGETVTVNVLNPNASSGGSNEETEEEIRAKAPGVIKAQDRAVTLQDYINLAKSIDGVYDAKAFDVNNAPELCLYHEVKVVILPEGGDTENTALVSEVYDYLYQRMIPPTNLQVTTPKYIPVDIDVHVTRNPLVYKYADDGVADGVMIAIQEYFQNRRGAVGEDFNPNDLIAAITSLPDVKSVTRITPNTPVEAPGISMITCGTVNIIVD